MFFSPFRSAFNKPYGVLTLLFIIYSCNAMDRHVVALLAEPIRKDLALSDTQLGLLSGLVFALFYTVLGIPAGWLADRLGRVRVIAVAAMVWSVCSGLGALSSSFAQLAFSRIGVAMGETGGSAPSYSLISEKFPPERRGHALGLFHVASPLATLVGALLCGWIAAVYGWRMALLVVSLPGVLFAGLLALLVREPPHAASEVPGGRSLAGSVRDFLGDPVMRTSALVAGLASFGTHAMLAWVPAFLLRVKGMSLREMAAYYGLVSALSFGFGLWFGGWLADRAVRRSGGAQAYALVPAICLLLAAPLVPLAIWAPGWGASMLLWALPVMLAATFLAPAVTLIQSVAAPAQRSIFGAIYLLANNLVGLGLGPLCVGMVSDALKPIYGDGALAYGLLAVAPVMLVGASGQFLLARVVKRRAA